MSTSTPCWTPPLPLDRSPGSRTSSPVSPVHSLKIKGLWSTSNARAHTRTHTLTHARTHARTHTHTHTHRSTLPPRKPDTMYTSNTHTDTTQSSAAVVLRVFKSEQPNVEDGTKPLWCSKPSRDRTVAKTLCFFSVWVKMHLLVFLFISMQK